MSSRGPRGYIPVFGDRNHDGRDILRTPRKPHHSCALLGAHKVGMRSVGAFCVIPTPILPLSFEDRLPGLGSTPEVSVTLSKELNIDFFGPHQSDLALSIDSIMPAVSRPYIDPTAPFAFTHHRSVVFHLAAYAGFASVSQILVWT